MNKNASRRTKAKRPRPTVSLPNNLIGRIAGMAAPLNRWRMAHTSKAWHNRLLSPALTMQALAQSVWQRLHAFLDGVLAYYSGSGGPPPRGFVFRTRVGSRVLGVRTEHANGAANVYLTHGRGWRTVIHLKFRRKLPRDPRTALTSISVSPFEVQPHFDGYLRAQVEAWVAGAAGTPGWRAAP